MASGVLVGFELFELILDGARHIRWEPLLHIFIDKILKITRNAIREILIFSTYGRILVFPSISVLIFLLMDVS